MSDFFDTRLGRPFSEERKAIYVIGHTMRAAADYIVAGRHRGQFVGCRRVPNASFDGRVLCGIKPGTAELHLVGPVHNRKDLDEIVYHAIHRDIDIVRVIDWEPELVIDEGWLERWKELQRKLNND